MPRRRQRGPKPGRPPWTPERRDPKPLHRDDESGISRHGGRQWTPKPDYGEESYKGTGKLTGKAAVLTSSRQRHRPRRGPGLRPRGGGRPDLLLERGGRRQGDLARVVEAARGEMRRGRGRHQREKLPLQAMIEPGQDGVRQDRHPGRQHHLPDDPGGHLGDVGAKGVDPRTLRDEPLRHVLAQPGAADPHMPEGGGSWTPRLPPPPASPELLPYAMTKAGIQNFTGGLAQMLGKKGIRADLTHPVRTWGSVIPATMPPEKVKTFRGGITQGRAGQPAEAEHGVRAAGLGDSSYMARAQVAVTRGEPLIQMAATPGRPHDWKRKYLLARTGPGGVAGAGDGPCLEIVLALEEQVVAGHQATRDLGAATAWPTAASV